MKKISIILIFVLISAIINPAYAQEQNEITEDGDYVEIQQNTPAPFSGLLFSYDGMSNALSRIHEKNRLFEIQKNEEVQKLTIQLNSEIKALDVKLKAIQSMHEAQMAAKEQAISSLIKEVELSKTKTYGGLVLGFTVGAIIVGLIYGNR